MAYTRDAVLCYLPGGYVCVLLALIQLFVYTRMGTALTVCTMGVCCVYYDECRLKQKGVSRIVFGASSHGTGERCVVWSTLCTPA